VTVSDDQSLTVRRFDSVTEFADHAMPFLAQPEAIHCLPIGICSTLIQSGGHTDDVYLATIDDGQAVVSAAVMTPPHNLVLSLVVPEGRLAEVFSLLASDLHARYSRLPGIIGPVPLSRRFAEIWRAVSGQPFRLGLRQRIYQLERVRPVEGAPGNLRTATASDRDLLTRWIHAFNQEALGEDSRADAEAWADRRLTSAAHQTFLWVDGEPVALVGCGGPTPNGMRIGPVFTPPEHRRRGYASAATAAVSQLILDGGHRFCFLFTDLANPTSNHIYQEIGYRPMGDVDVYKFKALPEESHHT
jgi:GNAT superfamily N-acetyltransferase